MFIRIKENKLYDWAGYKYAEDCQEIDIDYSTFEPEKYAVIEGVLTDISNTPEYIAEQAEKAKEQANAEIIAQLDKLSLSAVRALINPTEIKDAQKGETWLQHYKKQMDDLRAQLQD